VEGLKYEAVAAVLEVPVKTVRSRLSRARASLRVIIEGEVVGEGQAKAGEIEGQGAA
jgi:DNA-directed RNA polymerase specialized sigma24 family protein